MRREGRNSLRNALNTLARSVKDRVKRWRGQPPEESGVREPRRPRPPRPAGAVALEEPRIAMYRRWMPRDRHDGAR
jgi:hypothetical protein